LSVDPDNGAYLDSLGWAYYKKGEFKLAEKYLRQAVEQMPDDGILREHLGEIYSALGNMEEARRQWKQALEFFSGKDTERIKKKLLETIYG